MQQSREAASLKTSNRQLAAQLRKYAGLPPDLAQAKATHAEEQARLARLRQKVQQGLSGL